MKSKLLLAFGIAAVLLVVGVILKNNAGKKLDKYDQKYSVTETETKTKTKDTVSYWFADGDRWMIIAPNQKTVDYFNANEKFGFIFILNIDGTGRVLASGTKEFLFKFDYVLSGTVLTINDGEHDYYFRKYNDETFICSNNFGAGGVVKLKRLNKPI